MAHKPKPDKTRILNNRQGSTSLLPLVSVDPFPLFGTTQVIATHGNHRWEGSLTSTTGRYSYALLTCVVGVQANALQGNAVQGQPPLKSDESVTVTIGAEPPTPVKVDVYSE